VKFKEDKQEYFKVLTDTRENQKISIFREFMFTQADKFLTQQIQDLTKEKVTKKIIKEFPFCFK
jgi:hypothetical protein